MEGPSTLLAVMRRAGGVLNQRNRGSARPIAARATFAALAAVVVLAGSVAAASPAQTFKESGTSAFAFTGDCTPNTDGTTTCENQSIDVFEGTAKATGEPNFKGDRVCYGESTDTFVTDTGEPVESHSLFGCTLDPGTDLLTIDGLTSITLASTVIELTQVDCLGEVCTETPDGTTTVAGTWTAFGPTFRFKNKSMFDDGTCRQLDSSKSQSRDATFDGTIVAGGAAISQGSFTFKTTCPF